MIKLSKVSFIGIMYEQEDLSDNIYKIWYAKGEVPMSVYNIVVLSRDTGGSDPSNLDSISVSVRQEL